MSVSEISRAAQNDDRTETRQEALGRFLRERREALTPSQVGISSDRKRRTPGLRREEVAFLADIGVKWYARLEAGDDIHPSAAALTGIAGALRLTNAEREYLLDLAGGLRQPAFDSRWPVKIPKSLDHLLKSATNVAISVEDRILTPLHWNASAEALYGFSHVEDGIERNGLVRALFDPGFAAFLGDEHDQVVFNAAGMLRLNRASPSPSPFATAVYERVKEHPLFRAAWDRRSVSDELTQGRSLVRNHALLGRLNLFTIDFNSAMCGDWVTRIVVPATAETGAKFRRLEEFGTPMMPSRGASIPRQS